MLVLDPVIHSLNKLDLIVFAFDLSKARRSAAAFVIMVDVVIADARKHGSGSDYKRQAPHPCSLCGILQGGGCPTKRKKMSYDSLVPFSDESVCEGWKALHTNSCPDSPEPTICPVCRRNICKPGDLTCCVQCFS